MLEMVTWFPSQLEEAMDIGKSIDLKNTSKDINLVFVSGMGGSGIGADFVSSFIRAEAKIPYLIGKSYDPPNYLNEQSLVIASSYSGNTEETLSCVQQLHDKSIPIICITSGGKISSFAKEHNYDFVQVPPGWASPRACLGYSMVAQLYVLLNVGLISNSFETDLLQAVQLLKTNQEEIKEKARHLAQSLFEKTCIIYSCNQIEPVAIRFRQQINENAKRLCWHHVIPEMNHNELVGWRKNDTTLAVVFLRNSDDHVRNQLRIQLTKEIVSNFAGSTIELFSKGNSLIERSMYLVHLLDYASVYLAELNKVDAVEVKVIDLLKFELAKFDS